MKGVLYLCASLTPYSASRTGEVLIVLVRDLRHVASMGGSGFAAMLGKEARVQASLGEGQANRFNHPI